MLRALLLVAAAALVAGQSPDIPDSLECGNLSPTVCYEMDLNNNQPITQQDVYVRDLQPSSPASSWQVQNDILYQASSTSGNLPYDQDRQQCVPNTQGSVVLLRTPPSIPFPSRTGNTRFSALVSLRGNAPAHIGLMFDYDSDQNYTLFAADTASGCVSVSVRNGATYDASPKTFTKRQIRTKQWYVMDVFSLDRLPGSSSSLFKVLLYNLQSGDQLVNQFVELNPKDDGQLGLYCAGGGCAFASARVLNEDGVNVDAIGSPELDCGGCDKTYAVGSDVWCRCCGAGGVGCYPWNRTACIVNDGFCQTTCTASRYCDYPVSNDDDDVERPPPIPLPEVPPPGAVGDDDDDQNAQCTYGQWSAWSACSADCTVAGSPPPTQSRYRSVSQPLIVGVVCESSVETRTCNDFKLCGQCNCAGCSLSTHTPGTETWCRCCANAYNPNCECGQGENIFQYGTCVDQGFGVDKCLDTPLQSYGYAQNDEQQGDNGGSFQSGDQDGQQQIAVISTDSLDDDHLVNFPVWLGVIMLLVIALALFGAFCGFVVLKRRLDEAESQLQKSAELVSRRSSTSARSGGSRREPSYRQRSSRRTTSHR